MSLWLPTTKQRLGRLLQHGTTPSETTVAGTLLTNLSTNWRQYVLHQDDESPGYTRPGLYRFPVNWGDMDSMGHVNNVQYTRWAESSRINFIRSLPSSSSISNLCTPHGAQGLILRSIRVDYKFPVTYPDRVSVYHSIKTLSADAAELQAVVLSETRQRVAARVWEEVVVYDYKMGKRVGWEVGVRGVLEEMVGRQEKERERWGGMRRQVEVGVEGLEGAVLGRGEM